MSVVEKVRLSFYLTHTYAGDVTATLIAPDLTSVVVYQDIGGVSGDDFGTSAADADRCVLDDDAATSIMSSAPPYVGSLRPTNAMTPFVGVSSAGTWRLLLQDNSTGDTGTLQAASLFLTVAGDESRYETIDTPLAIPDDSFEPGVEASFVVEGTFDAAVQASYEVRVTPLILGVPGGVELPPSGPNNLTVIEEVDTTEVLQYGGVRVNMAVNEGRTGEVTISMHDPIAATLQPYQQALWIALRRPGEVLSEPLLHGQCNVRMDFAAETLTLVAQDPYAGKAHHHQVRRGDIALNVDSTRGRLPAHAESIDLIVEAARNIASQQDRDMPALGMRVSLKSDFTDPIVEESPPIEFERFQEVVDLTQQIVRMVGGPDMDVCPPFQWGADYGYASMDLYHAPTDPEAPGEDELGRNLDPADPDDPQPGEVIFELGRGLDNLEALSSDPGRPTTHAHVYDSEKNHRRTAADIASSQLIGAWVDAIEADFGIPRATVAVPEPDDTPLHKIAQARVRAYGVPPAFFTCVLRPIDVLPAQFGHPQWRFSVPEGVPYVGGDFYLGDYVRVRALVGEVSFSTLARIVGAEFTQDETNGLPRLQLSLIPAVGGTADENDEEAP